MSTVFTPVLALQLSLLGAAPLPYGGEASVASWRSHANPAPWQVETVEDLALLGLAYESLYRHDGVQTVPVIASGAVVRDEHTLRIPLKPDVQLHEARVLLAKDVIRSLESLVEPGHPGSYIMLAVRGARERLAGDPSVALGLRADAEGEAIIIELSEDYGPVLRLLASPLAAIHGSAPREREPISGTGAFSVVPSDRSTDLLAFARHRDGRPFLDRIHLSSVSTSFGARSLLRRERLTIAFGVPGLKASASQRPIEPKPALPPSEWTVLSLGRALAAQANTVEAIDAALQRSRLAKRITGGDAEPTNRFEGSDSPAPRPAALPPRTMTLLYSEERGPGRRCAERIQLDLLKIGLSVVISPVDPGQLTARRRDGRYDLLLDTFVLEGGPKGDPIDRFHRLLGLAARMGTLPDLIGEGELAAFAAAAPGAREARLRALDSALRRTGLLPLARRDLIAMSGTGLGGAQFDPFGTLVLSSTLPTEPTP